MVPFSAGTVVRPDKVSPVLMGTVRGVVELKNRTTEFPVKTPVADAPVPPPPVKVKVGTEVYPDPGWVIVME